MTQLSEITHLFATLAYHLQRTNSPPQDSAAAAGALALSISSLNESLNFNTSSSSSRVRVLDTALSLMCFKAPDLCNSNIQCLVDTILSLLSSSISCKVSRFPIKHDFLQVGSSISVADCPKLIEACVDSIGSLEGSGMLSYKLLRAVLKVATLARVHPGLSTSSIPNEKLSSRRNMAILKLHSFMPEEKSTTICETPLRLLFWYLDPLTLKHDISSMLREMVGRPFLCLKKELHDRMDWRSIIICLVISPAIFIEARALLHGWFLVTGLASILELRIELVSSALDVLSRPMWWGMSLELGLKLPFSHSYFPSKHQNLLTKLAVSISCKSFLDVVHLLMEPVVFTKMHLDSARLPPGSCNFRQTSVNPMAINHKSAWAMLMDFPAWFYFAALLLFLEKDREGIFPLTCAKRAVETEQKHVSELYSAAAKFLAWILSPFNGILYNQLMCCLNELSGSWTLKRRESGKQKSQGYLDTCNTDMASQRKKLKKPRKNDSCIKDYNVHDVEIWLKDFNRQYVLYQTNLNLSREAKETSSNSIRPNLLFRRIPLGILIGNASYSDEENELLLHYAATGEILQSRLETQYAGTDHINKKSDDYDYIHLHKCLEEDNERKAIAGASLVFNLFDVIDDMSSSMFENEDSGQDFVCHVKSKVVRYVVKCIKKLLELPKDEGRVVLFMDLSRRLERWRQQGREIFEGHEILTGVVRDLNSKIS